MASVSPMVRVLALRTHCPDGPWLGRELKCWNKHAPRELGSWGLRQLSVTAPAASSSWGHTPTLPPHSSAEQEDSHP